MFKAEYQKAFFFYLNQTLSSSQVHSKPVPIYTHTSVSIYTYMCIYTQHTEK